MEITLEQAKAFEATVRLGTIQKAAQDLNKGHSGVLYLIKNLEEQSQIQLFDRSGYRNKLTPKGSVVLKYCQQLIRTQNSLIEVCQKMHEGWEPSLKLIYDGVIDFNIIANALNKLNSQEVPTELKVLSAYLDEVETVFEKERADLMLTVLPIHRKDIVSFKLKPIKMILVAGALHRLSTFKNKKASYEDLHLHTCIKIKKADFPIGLSTESLDISSTFLVNDFSTKKTALLKGLGYGWMPDYLIEEELRLGTLMVVKTEIENTHFLQPRLFHPPEKSLGKTSWQLIEELKQN